MDVEAASSMGELPRGLRHQLLWTGGQAEGGRGAEGVAGDVRGGEAQGLHQGRQVLLVLVP
ncbi:hypothetical protein [Streptomyces adelaidensis]|uniref:hypothetical protein n=1 Tax=Streptomyces adelaidensis TaxID=2796465 RepID=UPI001F2B1B8E|nr:hypothetical protein [Streptomyces adelaidensis]